jgi:hypothetical protein
MPAGVLAEDWLTVAGLSLLAIGTGAQALASLSDYRNLLRSLPKDVREAFFDSLGATAGAMLLSGGGGRWKPAWLVVVQACAMATVFVPYRLAQVRKDGGADEKELARFLRLTGVWTTLMVGSLLVLAGAVVQLVLAR